ncbi:UDP-glucuronosyl/UDP-glucosyltransferase [Artemisia annua]|uniref:Glycosyltransferase n=1 Tax=Artemisia annua TaxID=35608 RepID=A0A2U1PQ13_ARTAN|nr:UDP-glucuronosyl/UDP-glucosyltransferase [Artemisia annua]
MEGHIVIFPSPGMGHLIPLVELAQRLLDHRRLFITFIIPTAVGATIIPQNDILNAMPENISTIFLPPVDLNDIPDDAAIETRIALTMSRSFPSLRQTLAELTRTSKKPSALVVDLFGTPSFETIKDFDIPAYIFCTVSAMSLVSIFQTPILDKMYACELRDILEPVTLPGCVPVHGSDMSEPLQDKKNEVYNHMIHSSKLFSLSKGILINSFFELEPGAFKALEEGDWCKPDVYSVGPLIRSGSRNQTNDGIECLKWLDKHPVASVLFVSFGSGGTLSQEQINELAFGLEQSGQRFLWVIKSPHRKSNASYFNAQSHLNPFGFLPDGFLERVKDRGLLVSSWAPQVEILGHGSTGGFLTHCGWNSILESVVNGVPMIAWPLFAEQRMNAVLLTDGLGVAYRVKVDENGLVGRDEIDKCVKNLIAGEDGRKMRLKVSELKDLAALATSQDSSSTKSLLNVAQKWVE